MASSFIGLEMVVMVRGAQLKGTVSAVDPGASLTLSNVWRLDTNGTWDHWEPRVVIRASDIVDLKEIPSIPAPAPAPVPNPVATVPPPTAHAFIDPAIVSVGKKPAVLSQPLQPLEEPRPHPGISKKRAPPPQPPTVTLVSSQPISQDATPTATVSASVEELSIKVTQPTVETLSGDEEEVNQLEIGGLPAQEPRRRTRRGNRRHRNAAQDEVDAGQQPDATNAATGQGKGWRQTPMLQSTPSFQPYSSLKRNGAKGKAVNDQGWASEDVTDVQEAGDFDFEGALAKFDKRNLFEQMRKDDQISNEGPPDRRN